MEPTVLIVAGLGLAAAALRTPLLALARACPALGYIGGGSCTTFVWWRSEGDALLCAVVLGMALGFSVAIARSARERAIRDECGRLDAIEQHAQQRLSTLRYHGD
jgi:hypothetical protein